MESIPHLPCLLPGTTYLNGPPMTTVQLGACIRFMILRIMRVAQTFICLIGRNSRAIRGIVPNNTDKHQNKLVPTLSPRRFTSLAKDSLNQTWFQLYSKERRESSHGVKAVSQKNKITRRKPAALTWTIQTHASP